MRYATLLILTAAAAQTAWPAVSFKGLGDLPGGVFYSTPTGVSSDGKVVVGQTSNELGWVAFRWTESGGMAYLGDLPGGPVESLAFAVSADGSAVTGWSKVGTNDREAFVWTQGGGMQGLGDLPGGSYFSVGRGVTNGGTRVVGAASNAMGWEAMYWSAGSGLVGLGDLTGDYSTTVTAVTPDGVWYVGSGRNANGTVAFLAGVGSAKQQLGELPGGIYKSTANGISADGKMVVGSSNSASGEEAFRWTAATGMQGLGELPGGSFYSSAQGVSTDGAVIVGLSSGTAGYRAVLWRANGSLVDLNVYLPSLGINLGKWVLDSASAVTPDGKVIVGSGTNPDGNTEAWIARIGDPVPTFNDIWGDTEEHELGWRLSGWYGWLNAPAYPTLRHAEHGWQYCAATDPQSIPLYDHSLQAWLWTSPAAYPFIYRYGTQPAWLYYYPGGTPGQRWFHDYGTGLDFQEAGPR